MFISDYKIEEIKNMAIEAMDRFQELDYLLRETVDCREIVLDKQNILQVLEQLKVTTSCIVHAPDNDVEPAQYRDYLVGRTLDKFSEFCSVYNELLSYARIRTSIRENIGDSVKVFHMFAERLNTESDQLLRLSEETLEWVVRAEAENDTAVHSRKVKNNTSQSK